MSDKIQDDLRSVLQTLNGVHRVLKAQRRELAQTVGGVEDIEMVGARVGFAIRSLSDARDLYNRLCAPADAPHVTHDREWRKPQLTHPNHEERSHHAESE